MWNSKNRPGVYILLNVENGFCIAGQTVNFRRRFSQYRHRGSISSTERGNLPINENFYNAVQEAINRGLNFNQAFQRFVVYTWIDENKQPLDIDNSIVYKNEMSYLEHRLILAFFECGLCYNLNDSFPQLQEVVNLPPIQKNPQTPSQKSSLPQLGFGANRAKPFKVNDFLFFSQTKYENFRKSLDVTKRRKFLAFPSIRQICRDNVNNMDAPIRYLTTEEILQAQEKNLFTNVNRE